ncbi:hypothetical protein [Paenibacillus polymyxa]|uniref:hypothetical protein n=2 Tax=Paenibacillus TaxID=44249 RepID=UPI00211D932F|nr:hypothetical protein [Paenibacillus polymyxa]
MFIDINIYFNILFTYGKKITMINVYPKYERMIEMKKKLLVGLLTVVACFTLGSTSFAATAVTSNSSNVSTESAVAPAATKYITWQIVLPKSQFPTLGDIPTTASYNVDPYRGTLTLSSVDGQTGYTWTVTYAGWVTY